jgi:hypothetical protein
MPCGIDLDFTALKDKLSALKDSAMAEINSTVAAAGAAAQAKMDAFESTIRGWVDELPDLPSSDGVSMLPDLLALLAVVQDIRLHPENLGNYQVLNELRKQFEAKYGDALSKAGANIDELLDGLDMGIDPCSLVPNILTKPDGTVSEVPKDPLYAKTDAIEETVSTEIPEMKALRSKISSDLSTIITTTELTESNLALIPETYNTKKGILESTDITSYFETSVKIENLDLEMSESISSNPTTFLRELENVRQNNTL